MGELREQLRCVLRLFQFQWFRPRVGALLSGQART